MCRTSSHSRQLPHALGSHVPSRCLNCTACPYLVTPCHQPFIKLPIPSCMRTCLSEVTPCTPTAWPQASISLRMASRSASPQVHPSPYAKLSLTQLQVTYSMHHLPLLPVAVHSRAVAYTKRRTAGSQPSTRWLAIKVMHFNVSRVGLWGVEKEKRKVGLFGVGKRGKKGFVLGSC